MNLTAISPSASQMPKLTVRIAKEVTAKFPDTKVAFLLAKINVGKADEKSKKYLTSLKQRVIESMLTKEVTPQNYRDQAVCQSWRKVFGTFDVDADKVSTIESLLKRAANETLKIKTAIDTGRKKPNPDFGTISNFVDFYNCVSMETMTPMGALDLKKIDGPIELRYGRDDEKFTALGREEQTFVVTSKQIVYADSKSVLTWLWNYRDAKHCCVPKESYGSYILLFADQAEQGAGDAVEAIRKAKNELTNIGGQCLLADVLSADHPETEYDLSALDQGIVTSLTKRATDQDPYEIKQ